jgi:hypothetical protein
MRGKDSLYGIDTLLNANFLLVELIKELDGNAAREKYCAIACENLVTDVAAAFVSILHVHCSTNLSFSTSLTGLAIFGGWLKSAGYKML